MHFRRGRNKRLAVEHVSLEDGDVAEVVLVDLFGCRSDVAGCADDGVVVDLGRGV